VATQYVMGQDGVALPNGVIHAHQVHGEPANQTAPAYSIGLNGEAVRPVGETGIGFEVVPEPPPPVVDADGVIRVAPKPNRDNKCRAKDDTCNGWAISGSSYCAAHAGKLRRAAPSLAEGEQDRRGEE